MNNAATWSEEYSEGREEKKSSAGRGLLALFALVLLLCIGATTWMIWQGTETLSELSAKAGSGAGGTEARATATVLTEFDGWVTRAVATAVGGGMVLLLLLRVSVAVWQRKWRARSIAFEENWRKQNAALEVQLSDSRKSEAQLLDLQADARKHAEELGRHTALLQGELDKLKRTEKTLAQQRQSLESSKTVLELHVEARTKDLRTLQRRYEHILNSAGEGICGLDLEGHATFVNPAVEKLTGWSIEEIIGKTEREISGRDAVEGQEVADGRSQGEQAFYRKDGSAYVVEFVKTPINENGRVVGSVLVFKDISERKRVEETLSQKAAELARSNSELEQFAFVASHDLQEPLRKIQAFGDRLKTKCETQVSPEAKDYLERMQNAAARMRKLIDDLLAFSRAIRSTEPFAPVDLGVAAKEVLGDLEVLIEKAGARVEVGELPAIEADPMQMRQLILNLVGNALKFQPPGGSPLVKIHARMVNSQPLAESGSSRPPEGDPSAALPLAGQYCELSIEDNGIGFDEKYTEKIFAVFQRLHGRNEYEGSGVGLAVCRRITDRHGGKIVAKSQPGKGSTFIVSLPARQQKAEAPL
jgi:PAS domain S-box-containing protein